MHFVETEFQRVTKIINLVKFSINIKGSIKLYTLAS